MGTTNVYGMDGPGVVVVGGVGWDWKHQRWVILLACVICKGSNESLEGQDVCTSWRWTTFPI